MYFILSPAIAIRYYKDVGYGFFEKGKYDFWNLSEEEYFFLKNECDGKHNIKESQEICDYINEGLIIPVECGDYKRTDWQVQYCEDTNVCSEIKIAITQECNYNCLYCFTEYGTGKLHGRFTYDEFTKLIDEACELGVSFISLTGGEPFLHKDLYKMIKYVYSKGMLINEILTNGSILSDDILELLKLQIMFRNVRMRISFDGINGKHNEVRQTESDEDVINGIKKCISKGLHVRITYNLNKFTENVLYDTIIFLESLGIDDICIARTTPTPKWLEFAPGSEIGIKEWYDKGYELLQWYANNENVKSDIDFWNYFVVSKKRKTISISPIRVDGNSPNNTCCLLAPQQVCINGDGTMTPCHQVSGALKYDNKCLGNAKTEGLKKQLTPGCIFHDILYMTTDTRKKILKDTCGSCEYYEICKGGCPIICWSYRKDVEDFPYTDITKCTFFKNNYHIKTKEFAEKYFNVLEEDIFNGIN